MEHDFFIPTLSPSCPPPRKFKRAGCDTGPHFSTHLQAECLPDEEVGKSRRSPPLEKLLKKSLPKCSAIYMGIMGGAFLLLDFCCVFLLMWGAFLELPPPPPTKIYVSAHLPKPRHPGSALPQSIIVYATV